MDSPDINLHNQAEVEGKPPPTFKETTTSVLKLTEVNPRAARLVQLLSEKRDSWNAVSRPDQTSPQPVDQRAIGQIVSWLTHSSDFQSLNEVGDFLEEYFRNNIDSQNQRLDEREYQGHKGVNSIGYREAKDKVFTIVEGFVKANKKDTVTNELDYWSSGELASGGMVLQNRETFERSYQLKRIEMGDLIIYTADIGKQALEAIKRLTEEMKQIIAGEPAQKGRVHMLLVPDGKFCPRGGAASPDGRRIIVDFSQPDKYRVIAHEYTHSYLDQIYGVSTAPAALEGAAVYFARERFPLDPRNDYGKMYYGFSDVVDLAQMDERVGLSPTQMLERRGRIVGREEAYEHVYRFGGFLTDYIVAKFGREKFLEFYSKTCQKNLFSTDTGTPLVVNGAMQVGVRQRDIIAQALRSIGIDPSQVEQEFDIFIKGKTIGNKNG